MRGLTLALFTLILTACSSDATSPVTSLAPTEVDPDAGDISADVGGVPDVRPTEADASPDTEPDATGGRDSDSAPEVVQPDVGQPSEDSGELPAPSDQCTGPFDAEALTDRTALQVTTWECLVDCGRDVAPDQVQACTLGCIDRTTELTPGCSGCFAELGTCALDAGCFETCAEEPDGWRCAYCQFDACGDGFRACAGVEVWRTAEACVDEGRWGSETLDALGCSLSEPDRIEECRANIRPDAEDYPGNPECLSCAQHWFDTLATECPACNGDRFVPECIRCANGSEALRSTLFCGGGELRRPEPRE
jgi:hypothetical protein